MAKESSTNSIKLPAKWLFEIKSKAAAPASELTFGRVKAFLYESLYRAITKHDLDESFKLLGLLPRETSFDPYVLFRFTFILIESNRTEAVSKNVIIYLESLMSKLDLNKPDIFTEFLAYFIKHNRVDDARELFANRHRFMTYRTHSQLPYIDTNLQCYQFLLNYLEWDERISRPDVNPNFDVSIQGWIVNALDCLKSTTGNYEYFVTLLVKVLLFYGFFKKAYIFVSEFQRRNPDNIGAQLSLFHLIGKLKLAYNEGTLSDGQETPMETETSEADRNSEREIELKNINNFSLKEEAFNPSAFPISEDEKSIVKNLRRLDPGCVELMALRTVHDNLIDVLRDIMDGLEVLSEVRNADRWTALKTVLHEIFESNEDTLILDARFLWHTRYKRFWRSIDFLSLIDEDPSSGKTELVGYTLDMISTNLDRPIV